MWCRCPGRRVCRDEEFLFCGHHRNLGFYHVHTDIRLRNMLARFPRRLDELSTEQFYEEYGNPETISVTRRDGKPIPADVLSAAAAPLNLGEGKRAD